MNTRLRVLNIIIESCLISLVIFTPLALGTTQPWSIFIMRITVVVALVAWLLKIFTVERGTTTHDSLLTTHHLGTPLLIPILIFLSIAVISTITSSYKWTSLNILTNLFVYAAIYFLIVNNLKSKKQVKRLITVILFTSLILGIYGLLQYFNVLRLTPSITIPGRISSIYRISSTYYNSNHYGGYLAMITPIPVALFLFSRLGWKTLLFAALSILLVINLALSYSWGSVAFGVGIIFLIVMRVKLSKRRILATAIAVGVLASLAVLGASVMLGPTPQLPQATWAFRFSRMAQIANPSVFDRFFMYKKTVPLILDHPFLGTGLGMFRYTFTPYRPPQRTNLWWYPHNDYLQIASEMGLIGLAAFLFLVITAWVKGLKALKSTPNFNRAIILGALAGILSILTHGFFDGNLSILPANILYFYVLIGVLVSSTSNLEL